MPLVLGSKINLLNLFVKYAKKLICPNIQFFAVNMTFISSSESNILFPSGDEIKILSMTKLLFSLAS